MAPARREYQPGDLVPGSVYRVVRLIGAGGMGTVYDVEDTTVGRRYVLKTLHPELGDRPDLAKRMVAEARTLALVMHPNIVEVVTAGTTLDDLRLPFYVMEKLNGQNLRTILNKKKTLELQHALHIAIDLLDALGCAHDNNVIHRDVKPDNIFLHRTANGTATLTKLLDFGVMHAVNAGPGITAGRFMGTLRYAAPEQLNGGRVTPQTDLYATALVLYEMIAGRGPFDELREQKEIANAHLEREPPHLLDLGAVVPETLEKLLRSGLAKNPASRPKDAFTFGAQLRNLARVLQERPAERTGDRKTVAAVLTPSDLSQPLAGLQVSPVVESSAAFANTERAPTRPDTPGRNTLIGSPILTPRGTLENASEIAAARTPPLSVTATSATSPRGLAIDRDAETRSMALADPMARMPERGPEGTEPIPLVAVHAPWATSSNDAPHTGEEPNAAAGDAADDGSDAAVQQLLGALPREQVGPRSDGGSTQMVLPVDPLDRKRSLARVLAALGALGIVAVGALSIVLRMHHAGAVTDQMPSAVSILSPAVPPPILAPPLFDEIPSATASAPAPTASAVAAVVAAAPPKDTPPRPKPPRASRPAAVSVAPSAPVPPAPPTPTVPTPAPKHRLPGSGL